MKKAKKKKINLQRVEQSTRRIYEMSTEIAFLQEELDDMLSVINKNFMDFKRGRLARQLYKANEKKLKAKSLTMIKKINRFVDSSLNHMDGIDREVSKQKMKVK